MEKQVRNERDAIFHGLKFFLRDLKGNDALAVGFRKTYPEYLWMKTGWYLGLIDVGYNGVTLDKANDRLRSYINWHFSRRKRLAVQPSEE